MKLLLTIAILLLTLACNAQETTLSVFSSGTLMSAGGDFPQPKKRIDTTFGRIYYYTPEGMAAKQAIQIDSVYEVTIPGSCPADDNDFSGGLRLSCAVMHYETVERRELQSVMYEPSVIRGILLKYVPAENRLLKPFDLTKEYKFIPHNKIVNE